MSDITVTRRLTRAKGRAVIRLASAKLKYATEEERRAARAMQVQERLARQRAERRARGLKNHIVTTDCRPPAEVIAARDAVPPPATVTAAILGDPPPGRSALDRRDGSSQ